MFTTSIQLSRSSSRSYAVSSLLHIAALIFILSLPILVTETIVPEHRAATTLLDPATLAPPKPVQKVKLPPPPRVAHATPFVLPKLTVPRPEIVQPELPVPQVKTEIQPPAPQIVAHTPAPPPAPKPEVRTNVFEASVPAPTPPPVRAERQVHTGAFGDPNGAQPASGFPAKMALARVGAFDAAPVADAGQKGARALVAATGFASASSPSNAGSAPPRAVVKPSGFGDVQAVGDIPKAVPKLPETAPTEPVEIVSKPVPAYTESAREKKIEGQVSLEVIFAADGKIRVLRVTRPLGHGLDESAMRAAEQIRFKPAKRLGQPVDFAATIHIQFQLAY